MDCEGAIIPGNSRRNGTHDDEEESVNEDPLFQFELQKSLQSLMEQLQRKKGFPPVEVSPNLLTTLRPYQQLGLEWLIIYA